MLNNLIYDTARLINQNMVKMLLTFYILPEIKIFVVFFHVIFLINSSVLSQYYVMSYGMIGHMHSNIKQALVDFCQLYSTD